MAQATAAARAALPVSAVFSRADPNSGMAAIASAWDF